MQDFELYSSSKFEESFSGDPTKADGTVGRPCAGFVWALFGDICGRAEERQLGIRESTLTSKIHKKQWP